MPLQPLLLGSFLLLAAPQPPACEDVASCRSAAVEAAALGNFELFHDLAWRAVQRGPRNDPELMSLLARAQSLSGRPGDALVMLRRLAEMGIATDARENDDFTRVRALPGWAELEPMIAALAEGREVEAGTAPTFPALSPAPTATPAPPPVQVKVAPEAPLERTTPAAAPPAAAAATPAAVPRADAGSAGAALAVEAGENALRLITKQIEPIGLAYDSVSRRFLVGDRRANRVVIADEVFNHVNDLIGSAAGGFGGLTALAIDTRRGDLWLTSSGTEGGAAIHKLQLVSGRLLATTELPEELRPVAFSDIAITDNGTLLLADSAGARLLAIKTAGVQLERPGVFRVPRPSSIAPAGEVTYVAHEKGLARADLGSGRVTEVRTQGGIDLAGLQRIRWHRGSLIALQQNGAAGTRLVRIRLNPGGTLATAVEPLDDDPATGAGALTISRDAAYFVAEAEGEAVIRRVELR